MSRLSSFSKALILLAVCYVGLAYGISPPLPAVILYLYMGLIIVGILSQIGVENEKLGEFVRPIRELLVDDGKAGRRMVVFTLLPVMVAAIVFSNTSVSSDPPAELRTVHPAPPPTIQFRGRDVDLAGLENPLRHDERELRPAPGGRTGLPTIKNCHFCHGDDLDGNGMFAHAFSPPPADFRDPWDHRHAPRIIRVLACEQGWTGIARGLGAVERRRCPPGRRCLTEEEIWQVILFMYDATDQVPRTWE